MASLKVRVNSPTVRYSEDFIEAEYEYRTTSVAEGDENDDNTYTVRIHTFVDLHLTISSMYVMSLCDICAGRSSISISVCSLMSYTVD